MADSTTALLRALVEIVPKDTIDRVLSRTRYYIGEDIDGSEKGYDVVAVELAAGLSRHPPKLDGPPGTEDYERGYREAMTDAADMVEEGARRLGGELGKQLHGLAAAFRDPRGTE